MTNQLPAVGAAAPGQGESLSAEQQAPEQPASVTRDELLAILNERDEQIIRKAQSFSDKLGSKVTERLNALESFAKSAEKAGTPIPPETYARMRDETLQAAFSEPNRGTASPEAPAQEIPGVGKPDPALVQTINAVAEQMAANAGWKSVNDLPEEVVAILRNVSAGPADRYLETLRYLLAITPVSGAAQSQPRAPRVPAAERGAPVADRLTQLSQELSGLDMKKSEDRVKFAKLDEEIKSLTARK